MLISEWIREILEAIQNTYKSMEAALLGQGQNGLGLLRECIIPILQNEKSWRNMVTVKECEKYPKLTRVNEK